MPIEFRSGLPGSSKTLGAVDHLMELRKTLPERPVYVLGINELREGLAHDLTPEQLEQWQELPPNSIILVDECQRYMPARRSGDPPRWMCPSTRVRVSFPHRSSISFAIRSAIPP